MAQKRPSPSAAADDQEPKLKRARQGLRDGPIAKVGADHTSDREDRDVSISDSSNGSLDDASPGSRAEDSDLETDTVDVIVDIGGAKKPAMTSQHLLSTASELRSRLSTLLPQLQQANRDLQGRELEANIEEFNEDQDQYIEMNLGLGVLEEKKDGDTSSEGSESSESSDEDDGDDDEDAEHSGLNGINGDQMGRRRAAEKDVMGRLLGVKRGKDTPGIEVMTDDSEHE